ncbi:C39 family peptidase [Thermosyntropha sp.]|uniref:C39 family peptidase n=1 Tax=Thermosyntropha sp. TaxID=2740820 RepID=UPI0025E35858|nr:C39 family peptidase [Thermosyntropha sp.]MBO8158942.1 C39 family peptidase [Thermosyntropha sp.]
MKRTKRILVGLMVSIMLTTMVPALGLADNAGLTENDTQTITVSPQTLEKNRLILELEEDVQNIISLEKLDGKDRTAYNKAVLKFLKKWKGIEINAADINSSRAITSKVLGVSAIGQETIYYCGPASAKQLLNYKNITTNPNDNRPATQSNLASDLNTSSSAGTPFPGTWESTLEDWTPWNWHTLWSPSKSDLKYYVRINCVADLPTICDTHMDDSNGYLPGYTTESWHYVTADGWRDDGITEEVHYVDPNRYKSQAFGAHWVSYDLMANLVADRGIVW